MEIQELLKNIWRKKWILLLVTLVGVSFTLLFLQFKQDKYTSTARISTGFTADDRVSLSEESRSSNRDGETKFANLLALMKSSIPYNLLSYKLLLHDLESMNGFHTPRDVSAELEEDKIRKIQMLIEKKFKNLQNKTEPGTPSVFTDEQKERVINILKFKLDHQEPLNSSEPDFDLIRKFLLSYGYDFKKIQNALTIQRIRGTDYVEVAFVSGNKYLSAYATNQYCNDFIQYFSSIKGENTSESLVILEEVVRQKKDSLVNKLEILKRYKTSEIISDVDYANTTRYDQLVELESKKDEIENRISELELTMKRLQDDLNNSGQGNSNNQEIIALQQKIKDLNAKYIDSGANDQSLSDSLAYLRGSLRNAIGNIDRQEKYATTSGDIREKIKDANIDYQVEENKLRQVNTRISNIRYGLSNNKSTENQLLGLENEIEVARKEYEQVLNKYNEAKNQQVALNPLKVVLKATPAVSPSSMPDLYILLISMISCFGFGLFVVILLTITDDKIRNSTRFKRMVNLPLLTVVNELKLKDQTLPSPRKIFKSKKTNHQIEFYKSSFRHLRYQMEETPSKVFLFTSLREKVGKSSIICSLAYTLSLLKKRVLIIDTNFKSNTLTRIFGAGLKEIKVVTHRMIPSKVKPLASVIQNGSVEKEEKEKIPSSLDLVNITKYDDIFFIGNSGVKGMSPMELLSRKDFKQFIYMMSEQFDYIFLEGPALNEYADAKELSEFVQKVVTVISSESKIEPIDEHSLKFIRSLTGRSAGAVLNRVSGADIKD